MAFAIPFVATAALNAGMISVGTAVTINSVAAAAGSIMSIGGTILSGLGALQQSKAEQQTAKTNAALQTYNQEVAKRNALLATKSAQLKADEQRRDTIRRVGAFRSAFSKAGVVSTAGSPLLAQETQAGEGEFEARKFLFEGLVQSSGYDSEAAIAGLKAQSELNKAKSAKKNSMFQTILTGVSLLS